MKTLSKQMSVEEARFTILMGDLGISPEVIKYRRIPDKKLTEKELYFGTKILLTLEAFPMDWIKFMKSPEYKKKRKTLIAKLRALIKKVHELGIFHGDLNSHRGNVVVDPENDRVALIDWGQSSRVEDLEDKQELESLSDSYDIEFKSANDVLKWELNALDNY
jgi:tRNA A-37 threonylcarbamoyl transferase component Bud32